MGFGIHPSSVKVNGQEVILAVGMHFSGHFYCGEVAVGKG